MTDSSPSEFPPAWSCLFLRWKKIYHGFWATPESSIYESAFGRLSLSAADSETIAQALKGMDAGIIKHQGES